MTLLENLHKHYCLSFDTGGITLYVRYRETEVALDSYSPYKLLYRVNKASLVMGILASFGISLVGNFQVKTF